MGVHDPQDLDLILVQESKFCSVLTYWRVSSPFPRVKELALKKEIRVERPQHPDGKEEKLTAP